MTLAPDAPGLSATLLVAAGVHTLSGRLTTGGRAARGRHADVGPVARALLIDGGRIAWVGADPRAAPPHQRAVDLGAAWITPAFVDAHVHGTATGLALTGLDLAGTGSVAECLDRLGRHAAERYDAIILGSGWDDFGWPERRPPRADEVAAAAPGRTVVLSRVDGHSCVVDSGTLAELPLADLFGVDRDHSGVPTGWLREEASEAARVHVLARLPQTRLHAARTAAARRAAELGIGCLHEMGHPGLSGLDDAAAWHTGAWPVEVITWWAELDAAAGPAHGLRPGGDLFLDGSIGSQTAAVSCGYADGGQGELFHTDGAVADFFTASSAAGRGAGVHAIGDRAIEQAVGAIEAAADAVGANAVRSCRHRIEHVELPRADQVGRMARLGVVASVQPAFDAAWGGDEGLYAERFGVRVARVSNPLAWLHDAGVRLAFGSDSTVTPLDPWGAVRAAEQHRGGLSIDRRAALVAHTSGGRYVAGQDDTGALQPGWRADVAVWDADPLTVADPTDVSCLLTVVAGGVVHGDAAA